MTVLRVGLARGVSDEEAAEMIRDAIRLHIADRLENGEETPQTEVIRLIALEIAV